jgi:hypothetical protein
MAVDGLPNLADRLAQARAARSSTTAGSSSAAPTPEQRLGLRFSRGDRVLDLATGQEGTVLLGERVAGSDEERFRVSLPLSGDVWRGRAELEPAVSRA